MKKNVPIADDNDSRTIKNFYFNNTCLCTSFPVSMYLFYLKIYTHNYFKVFCASTIKNIFGTFCYFFFQTDKIHLILN